MTYEEMKSKACVASSRSKPKNEEHKIQCSCVRYFRLKYPHLRNMLFAVPNAARRSARNGAYMKDEGILRAIVSMELCVWK